MKKAGKRLFQRLGELRDIQIMIEWLEKLGPVTASVIEHESSVSHGTRSNAAQAAEQDSATAPETITGDEQSESHDPNQPDPAMHALLEILKNREAVQKHEAQAALEEFDGKQWRQWSKSLPLRAAHIRPGSAVFKHLALERWTAARELHARAMRNRSQIALHTLRIGIKRFRYIVENFLPVEHKPWHARIVQERSKRVEEYRRRTVGPESLWNVWRAGLPQGKQIQEIATRRMKLWAKALDPDFAHSERVARLALELYDGLGAAGLLGFPPAESISTKPGAMNGAGSGERASLQVAALLHDVGKAQGNKGHHKASLELIKAHGTPLGWNAATMQRAALVARFHAGALPVRSHKALRDLLPDEQKIVVQLAAILRLANAFDAAHDGHIRRVRIENARVGNVADHRRRTNGFLRKPATLPRNEALIIAAEGYTPGSDTAQTIAAERHLLETILRRPVVVRAMRSSHPTALRT